VREGRKEREKGGRREEGRKVEKRDREGRKERRGRKERGKVVVLVGMLTEGVGTCRWGRGGGERETTVISRC
jgi:hypothetical protein